jgi:hypothetical protein
MFLYYFYLVDIPGTNFSYRLGEFLKNIIPSAFLTAIFYLVINWLPMRKEQLRNDRLIADVKNGGSYSINTIMEKAGEYLTLILLPDMIKYNNAIRKQKLMEFDCKLQNVCKTIHGIERSEENINTLNKVSDEIRDEIKFFMDSFKGSKNQPIVNMLLKMKLLLHKIDPNEKNVNFVILAGDFYYTLLLFIYLDKRVRYINKYIRKSPKFTILLK